jgi:hypothetical protein
LADRLKASGALDGIFDQIEAGEVPGASSTKDSIAASAGET